MSNATKMITNTCKIWLPFMGGHVPERVADETRRSQA